MSIETKLTGRIRYRVQRVGMLFKQTLVVLQVEEHRKGHTSRLDVDPYGIQFDDFISVNEKVWRDAEVQDLVELEEMKKG